MNKVHFVLLKADVGKSSRIKCKVYAHRYDGVAIPGEARALLIVITPNEFVIIPTSLKDHADYQVRWFAPQPGQPIEARSAITSCTEAKRVFAKWAQRTFFENWESTATRATREIREAIGAIDRPAGHAGAHESNLEAVSPKSSGAPKFQNGDCHPDDLHTLLDRMRR